MYAHVIHLTTPNKRAMQIMLVVLFILFASYVFLVNQTVRQVVERKELETQNNTLGSHVSELEFTYMRHKNDITPEDAYAYGFTEAQKVTFISRTPGGAVVTLNH